jgi:4'-phosphopantetheinyl transferase
MTPRPMNLEPTEWGEPFRKSGSDGTSIRIWRVSLRELAGDPGAIFRPLTTRSEHRRAQRYRFDADRHRHLAGRGLIRTFLAHKYDCAPQAPSITEGPNGKPQLNGAPGRNSDFAFNIAHTEGVVVAAFSRTDPVGIDVEAQGRDADMEGLVQRVFTASERRRWRKLSPGRRPEFFFQIWTCKEAFLKATGHGFQRAARSVECRFDGETVVGLDDADKYVPPSPQASAARWELRSFPAADGVIGAVVRAHSLPSPLLCTDATRHVNQFSRSRKTGS